MVVRSSHRPFLFAGLALAVMSAAGFAVLGWRTLRLPPGWAAPVTLADAPYTAAIAAAAPRSSESWNPPPPQSRGRDWVYDTFTPPQIFFNARSKQFMVKPPSGFAEEEPEEAFGLELVTIRPEPFRLQLIGYVGDDGHWRGTFENLRSGEVFLAAAGRHVASLGLTIKGLDVRLQPVALPGGMTTQQRVATAVVHDEQTGRDITLTHRERQFTGTLFAFLAAAGDAPTREVRTGDILKIGPATYRIDRIALAPPTVEVSKEAPTLAQPDRRILTPREAEGADGPGAP